MPDRQFWCLKCHVLMQLKADYEVTGAIFLSFFNSLWSQALSVTQRSPISEGRDVSYIGHDNSDIYFD